MKDPKQPWGRDWFIRRHLNDDGTLNCLAIHTDPAANHNTDILLPEWDHPRSDDDVVLASAAPKMARALLAIEWVEIGDWDRCPCCNPNAERRHHSTGTPTSHRTGCALDAALTAAGLDTKEKRNAARAELEAQRKDRTT